MREPKILPPGKKPRDLLGLLPSRVSSNTGFPFVRDAAARQSTQEAHYRTSVEGVHVLFGESTLYLYGHLSSVVTGIDIGDDEEGDLDQDNDEDMNTDEEIEQAQEAVRKKREKSLSKGRKGK